MKHDATFLLRRIVELASDIQLSLDLKDKDHALILLRNEMKLLNAVVELVNQDISEVRP